MLRRQGIIRAGLLASAPAAHGAQASRQGAATAGPQYDTAHVYIAPSIVSAFVTSWETTFGGTNTTPKVTDVTPTPSETISELALSRSARCRSSVHHADPLPPIAAWAPAGRVRFAGRDAEDAPVATRNGHRQLP